MEDFRYRLYVRQCIDEGMQALEEGRVYSHDEMREMVKSWRKSFGQSQHVTTWHASTSISRGHLNRAIRQIESAQNPGSID